MSNKYEAMSFDELKEYFLQHREDDEAFYAFIDRARSEGKIITIHPDDPIEKSMKLIEERLKETE